MICNSPPHSFSRSYISMKQKRGYLSHKYKYVYHLHLLLLPLMYSSTHYQHPSHHHPNSGVHLYFSDILVPLVDDEDMLSLEKFTAHLWLVTRDRACFLVPKTMHTLILCIYAKYYHFILLQLFKYEILSFMLLLFFCLSISC